MPIEETFNKSEEIIKPSDIKKPHHQTFKNIIITFQSSILPILIERKEIIEIESIEFGSAFRKYPIYQLRDDKNTLFFLSPIGAPITVALLEEITYVFEIKNIILYGTCGSLVSKAAEKSIIIPTKAYRDEGTSYHYIPSSDFIDLINHQKLSNILDQLNIDYLKGYTWTTDAFYRETKETVKLRKCQGCIIVEMEVSAVAAFATLRNLQLYAFLYVADNLDAKIWQARSLSTKENDFRLAYFLLAKEIVNKI